MGLIKEKIIQILNSEIGRVISFKTLHELIGRNVSAEILRKKLKNLVENGSVLSKQFRNNDFFSTSKNRLILENAKSKEMDYLLGVKMTKSEFIAVKNADKFFSDLLPRMDSFNLTRDEIDFVKKNYRNFLKKYPHYRRNIEQSVLQIAYLTLSYLRHEYFVRDFEKLGMTPSARGGSNEFFKKSREFINEIIGKRKRKFNTLEIIERALKKISYADWIPESEFKEKVSEICEKGLKKDISFKKIFSSAFYLALKYYYFKYLSENREKLKLREEQLRELDDDLYARPYFIQPAISQERVSLITGISSHTLRLGMNELIKKKINVQEILSREN
ncbi:MAG: hypothetical protein ACTSUK_07750 [Promethearchaeota archaeon]